MDRGQIRRLTSEEELEACAEVIRASFATVADELGLTMEAVPTHPAFIENDAVVKAALRGVHFYFLAGGDGPVGCVAVEKGGGGAFYIERLSVLPAYRRHGYGRMLLEHACDVIGAEGGSTASIAMINEQRELKRWYLARGFRETEIKKFPHLPFAVCFMSRGIADSHKI
ncbi:MAG: GNAT family N-acetyltransferase [Spirochaetes bacterium]|nr:GNAT family N-acetyltransferase [Spirochaetota bacterium]